ncbi:putative integral membrane protein [Cryptosporidium felis]|nr:putative integral membrane protein [Cryptosporidium felis]
MKITIQTGLSVILFGFFTSNSFAVLPSFIPVNDGVPDHELARLSQEVLPIIANKYSIQIFSDRIRMDSRPKCHKSEDFNGKEVAKGCDLGVYICDNDLHKQCLWVHKCHCQCSSPGRLGNFISLIIKLASTDEFLKLKECRISITKVPTGDPNYPYINVPIGECKLAVWILALITIFSAILSGLLIKLLITSIYEKK